MPSQAVRCAHPDKTRSLVILGFLLVVITVGVYWQVGNHEFINYDDNVYVYDNPHVRAGLSGANVIWAFTSVEAANWHPLTWLSHQADAQFYGLDPRGHHLTSVFIHAASAVLLLLLLYQLTGSVWRSAFVAALFALHPLHVESVAWVAERKDVLSAFFWFATLILYAAYAKRKQEAPASRLLYLLTLLSFLLGLMCKPMLVTLPLVMLLLDFWPLDRAPFHGRNPIPLLKEKIPFFACSLFSAAVTIYAQNMGGAIGSIEAAPFTLRLENALVAYITYIAKTLWPFDLAVLYPLSFPIPLWQVACSLLILLFVSVAVVRGGRQHPYLAVGWYWFLITLVPVIGLVQVGAQSMADRYSYLSGTGLFIMVAWGVPALVKGLRYRRGLLALVAGMALVGLTAVTWKQLGYWQDNISLYRHALQVTSRNYPIHMNLGIALDGKGDLDAAIREFRAAIALRPDYYKAHSNLGVTLHKKGYLDAAILEYREALAIQPNDEFAHVNLGASLQMKGELAAAIMEYREALRINPNFVEARFNLATVLEAKDDLDAAIKEYRAVLAVFPGFALAQNNLRALIELQSRRAKN